jgi:hypothetical protein
MLKRLTLIDQIEREIRQRISSGSWRDQLPSERHMCSELRVGRNSLRAALSRLQKLKLVEIKPGVGISCHSAQAHEVAHAPRIISLLSPLPLERLRPHQTLWIDELRSLASDSDAAMRFHCEPRCFRPRSQTAIAKCVRQNASSCWVLIRSTASMQSWFQSNRTSCVIAGSCHEGIDLPYVDLNHHATCRHAAITFLRMGHRQLAFLTHAAENAGDKQSELGFMEGVTEYTDRGAKGTVLHLNSDKSCTGRVLGKLMDRRDAPTAILVNQSYHYLTTFSMLLQAGKVIPRDVSLICRDHDTFLSFLEPTPTHYGEDAQMFAKKLIRVINALVDCREADNLKVNLLPQLISGNTLAPPRCL